MNDLFKFLVEHNVDLVPWCETCRNKKFIRLIDYDENGATEPCPDCFNDDKDAAFNFLDIINQKHQPFNPSAWIPPTFRDRIDKEGYQYRNIRYNPATKTHRYEMKAPGKKWSGPFHGRSINDFLKMDELTPLNSLL